MKGIHAYDKSVRDFPVRGTLKESSVALTQKYYGKLLFPLGAFPIPRTEFELKYQNFRYKQREFIRGQMMAQGVGDFLAAGACTAERIADSMLAVTLKLLSAQTLAEPSKPNKKQEFSIMSDMEPISSETLISKLAVIDENILSDAAKQPILFIDAARYRVAAMRKRAQAVAELDSKRSRIALTIRARKDAAGEKKFTEAALKEKVESQTVIRDLRAKTERAYESEEFSKLILEAYRMRRDAIRVIAESQIAEGMRGSKEVEHLEQSRRLRAVARDLDEKRSRVDTDD